MHITNPYPATKNLLSDYLQHAKKHIIILNSVVCRVVVNR